ARNEDIWIATQNQDSLITLHQTTPPARKWIDLQPEDFSIDIFYADGQKRHMESYYGSTYLSQSSRKIPVNGNVKKIVITDFRGNKREVTP
ncbi:MAG TPA: hypothetical protein VHC96_01280, partial [Puia sp.]|nr:hypothetical protein [Puia sp.]